MNTESNSRPAQLDAPSCAAPMDWPVEARISHRILLYASRCAPRSMNQFAIEDIVKEEMAKGAYEAATFR